MFGTKRPYPGIVLAEILRERGIKPKDFARALSVSEDYLSSLLRGQRDVTFSLSAAIGVALGGPASIRWYQLQEHHDKWKQDQRLDQ